MKNQIIKNKKSLIAFIFLLFVLVSCTTTSENNQKSMYVKGRYLYDRAGEKVILKGVNEMVIWSKEDKTGERTFPEIKKTGANVIRIVWTTHGSAEGLDSAITNCIKNEMIPMPELHDATGKLEVVPSLVDWWTSPEMIKIIKKHEKYLLLNIANEAGSHDVIEEDFIKIYSDAISKIRSVGIIVPLIIDAPSWGQGIDMLQLTGPTLIEKDSIKNIMFSVHMWWPEEDGSTDRIIRELQESVDMNLPLIVGEFAPMGVACKRFIDYKTILEECTKHNIGWLPWSFGQVPNGDCKEMDMTLDGTFGNWQEVEDFGKWGEEVCITSPYSIKNTSVTPASIVEDAKNIVD